MMATTEDTGGGFADLPPCLPWSSGPCVSVDGPCFASDSGCGPSFKACTENKGTAACQDGLESYSLEYALPACEQNSRAPTDCSR
jgi:hypothetical protein